VRSYSFGVGVWLAAAVFIGLLPFLLGAYVVLQQAYKVAVYRPVPALILEWGDQGHEGYRLAARYEYTVGADTYTSAQAFSTPRWADFGAANEVPAQLLMGPGSRPWRSTIRRFPRTRSCCGTIFMVTVRTSTSVGPYSPSWSGCPWHRRPAGAGLCLSWPSSGT